MTNANKNFQEGKTVKVVSEVVTKGARFAVGTTGTVERTFKPMHALGAWDITVNFGGYRVNLLYDSALTKLELA